MPKYILGLDGGGTYTRVALADETGKIITSLKRQGGSNPTKNMSAKENVQSTIKAVVTEANITMDDIGIIVAGIAGVNTEQDLVWAKEYLSQQGLTCPKIILNDTIPAGVGALKEGTGIIVVAGTGSMVTGFTETGEVVSNRGNFNHDARAGAVKLCVDTVKVLSEQEALCKEDSYLLSKVLNHYEINSLEEMKHKIVPNLLNNDVVLLEHTGKLSSIVTLYAKEGSIRAQRVCENAMKNLANGVHMVSECFNSDTVPVVVQGGVIEDNFMQSLFTHALGSSNKIFVLEKPDKSPLEGAIKIGLERLGSNHKVSLENNLILNDLLIYNNRLVGLRLSSTVGGQHHYDVEASSIHGVNKVFLKHLAKANKIGVKTLVDADGLLVSPFEVKYNYKVEDRSQDIMFCQKVSTILKSLYKEVSNF